MANLKRLTDRVKKLEQWLDENGNSDHNANLHYLIQVQREMNNALNVEKMQTTDFKNLFFEFLEKEEMANKWNEFVKEKENAIQKQQAEEVSVQEQAEGSEEAIEAQEEEE